MIRMFPLGRRRVVSVADLATGRRPGFGSYASLYSFSKEKHGNGLHGYVDPRLGWAELRLGNGRFITGVTGESLGVLVALGDVPSGICDSRNVWRDRFDQHHAAR